MTKPVENLFEQMIDNIKEVDQKYVEVEATLKRIARRLAKIGRSCTHVPAIT